MKLNKILSSALALVMVFSSIFVLFPTKADAAYIANTENSLNSPDDVSAYVTEVYTTYNFKTAEEMLIYENSLGYLRPLVSADGKYAIYVNAYTGVLYYQNRVTGQILTSNPWYYTANSEKTNRELLSQLNINFSVIATSTPNVYSSSEWAAERGQITTEYISSGIRVNYTLGDTTVRYLLPGVLKAEKYEEMILVPMLQELCSLMEEHCAGADYNGEYNPFEYEEYSSQLYKDGYLYISGMRKYLSAMKTVYSKLPENSAGYKAISALHTDINTIMAYYTLKTSSDVYGIPVYELRKIEDNAVKSQASNLFRKYCGSYTLSEMLEDEEELGYVDKTQQKPVFTCSLEYSFNSDGSLCVRLPASSISFDETVYTLDSVSVLPYFGAGDLNEEGYIFYPDGSGAVSEFEDFASSRPHVTATVYGTDYCYSNITGEHREQITMPVFGLVTEDDANASTSLAYGVERVTNGYFAIIEEGASLANLEFVMGGLTYRFGHVYCSYTPYPADEYDLSETVSVGGAVSYKIVSESKYNGSYVTRYAMLTDEKVDNTVKSGYVSSYMGMVNYYRDYLYANGTLSALETVTDDMPLYIEVLGAMDIVKKILTFPVETSIPLTKFEDIATIYEELSGAVEIYTAKAAEYDKLAAESTEEYEKLQYAAAAQDCRDLVSQIQNITNINFRLTGFANGGLYSTYPTKIKWSRACGGKKGLRNLLETAESVSAKEGSNFGIYPDFDFSYINNTSASDGIRIKGNVSRMVDNRYASKQSYNSVLQEYESFYSLVVNPESFEELYSKFIKKYSKYEISAISVSTLGSDLNSNFDKKQPVNRDEAEGYVTAVLEKMSGTDNLDIMLDKGNAYSLKYADHILNANIDSSHLAYSSYTVPFVGMVLHGSVNYTGTPINYSGTTAYDILRAIESGASLYYILAFQSDNIGHMKEDELLSEYYGVDYSTWHDNILITYSELNSAIGGLQKCKITDHRIIKGERVIEVAEWEENYKLLIAEFVEELDALISARVHDEYEALKQSSEQWGCALKVNVDTEKLLKWFAQEINCVYDETAQRINLPDEIWELLRVSLDEVAAKYENEYNGNGGVNEKAVTIDAISYESEYSFVTDSFATDDSSDYKYTNYTSDIGNIVLVTYSDGTMFILNYNIYSVDVNLGGKIYTLGKYEYQTIKAEGGNE